MTFPKGTGWQRLRALAFDAIPAGTRTFYTRAVPMHEWRERGAFTAITCTKSAITLEAADSEIGSVLLGDAEFLLDHAAEHRSSVARQVFSAEWNSPAWLVVTIYYWVFFAALVFSRLAGKAVLYLDRDEIDGFRLLASGSQQPGAGAFVLNTDAHVTATTRHVVLSPAKGRFHDVCWRIVQHLVLEVFHSCDQTGNPLEYRLWWCLKRIGEIFGPAWPSELRNSVNYRAGYGYREVIRRGEIDVLRTLRNNTPTNLEKMIDQTENEIIAVQTQFKPGSNAKVFSRILGYYATLMNSMVEELHSEIVSSGGGDSRWQNLRRAFIAERCANALNVVWPLGT